MLRGGGPSGGKSQDATLRRCVVVDLAEGSVRISVATLRGGGSGGGATYEKDLVSGAADAELLGGGLAAYPVRILSKAACIFW